MKKFLTVLAIFTLVVFAGNAQVIKPAVGLNFTGITGAGNNVKGKAGWQIGASLAVGEKLYFEPGIFYMGKSLKYTDASNPNKDNFKDASLKGVRVPVAVGLNLLGRDESTVALRVFGGGSGFFLTNVSDDLIKDDYNSATWGVFAGAGLDFSILFVEAAYEWSVTDIQDKVSNVDFGKTRGLYATAGLRFRL
jgi:hypothetical protein